MERSGEGKRSSKYKVEEEEEVEDEEEDEELDEFNLGDDGRKKMRDLYSKGGSSSSMAPSCQVEGCDSDLSEAKHYHRRHKVCEFHAKAASVLIAGLHQRFCQQCSRLNLFLPSERILEE
ncbi:squamosa promoter-binding-like protein 3 isoform X2 [Neltuma alba]|uniref:squamosa promoter-binding-like protein 3 isoform X2 n=1 Tax=Neltuma alba TaxID=207710 RepID=UPI0010A4DE9A|nr:squamosa promoter-binding-like protein 3 isoform X2 [Prosopis alba]